MQFVFAKPSVGFRTDLCWNNGLRAGETVAFAYLLYTACTGFLRPPRTGARVRVCSTLFLLAAVVYPALAWAVEPSPLLQVRILDPITSYGQQGAAFRAVVIGPVDGGSLQVPAGTILHGAVQARSVGLGLKRERSAIKIEFKSCELPGGIALPCTVQLQSIDNAREEVISQNRVRGVLAANNVHSMLSGFWFRPAPALIHRSATGLTGASLFISERFAPGPMGAAIVIGARLLLLRMPEPEIELPAGTEMLVRLGAGEYLKGDSDDGLTDADVPPSFREWLSDQPAGTTQSNGKPVTDLINVVFRGSRDQVIKAFAASSWSKADAMTPRTVARTYAAYTSMSAYRNAPVSAIHYSNRLPDLVFQKSFNSVSKRHHIRLWATEFNGTTIWLAAGTHDTSAAFDWRRVNFTHRVDPAIDRERSKILNDLRYAGCVSASGLVDRPNLVQTGSTAITDGAVAVVVLQECTNPGTSTPLPKRRRSSAALFSRRIILETRNYWTRSNAYYWAVRGVRWTFSSRPQSDTP